MPYGGLEDLPRTSLDLHRCDSDKVIHNKAFNILENAKYDEYQHRITSIVYKYFDKRFSEGTAKSRVMSYQQLAEELHAMRIIRKFGKRKVKSSFQNNIWSADFADKQLLRKYYKDF